MKREREREGGGREGTEIIKEREPKQSQRNVHSDQYCVHAY